jgi:Fe-S-cluster containining protein
MLLFPYDIILLKQKLSITSSEFLQKYTSLCGGSHPYFPGLQLKMSDEEDRSCPFLSDLGCTVYKNRPSSCRTYPLERGVENPGLGQSLRVHYFLTHHPYCKGHLQERRYTVTQWERDQNLHDFNFYNDQWAELDAFFATNPWAGEGKAGPYQQLAFMACYDIDAFRHYSASHLIFNKFRFSKDERKRMVTDDGFLLQCGFRWLEFILGGKKKLLTK